jgi:hypothetical protein
MVGVALLAGRVSAMVGVAVLAGEVSVAGTVAVLFTVRAGQVAGLAQPATSRTAVQITTTILIRCNLPSSFAETWRSMHFLQA